MSSLKRLAKKAGLRWKRVRKSLKSLRDPDAFAKAKRELEALQKQEDQGKIDLYYFDESGFALDPTIPYAWQEPNSVIELPARRYGRINVLGFMNRHNDLHPFMFEDSIHTGVVIACFDAFCQTITKKTVVVMDNASIHTSEDFEDRLPYWKQQGLMIKYLPQYSPELNLIEILWRRIKYTWLPFSAYACLNALSEALEAILARISHSLVKIRVFSLQDVNEPGTCQRMAIIRANAPVLVLSDASGVCFSVTFRGSGKALRALVVQAQ